MKNIKVKKLVWEHKDLGDGEWYKIARTPISKYVIDYYTNDKNMPKNYYVNKLGWFDDLQKCFDAVEEYHEQMVLQMIEEVTDEH